MTDPQRAAFEAAMEKQGRIRPFLRDPDGDYTDMRVYWAWVGFQAAQAADAGREAVGCIAPQCHQWDGTDTCTCQRREALDVLQRIVTALPVLKAMLSKEGLAGAEIAEEMMVDARATLSRAKEQKS